MVLYLVLISSYLQ